MKLSDKAIIPTKGSRFAVGDDICALTDGLVPAKGQTMVETGIAIGLPEGTYGRLGTRCGMASKMGIAVSGGVIDADYKGEVQVILRNHGEKGCVFKAGYPIAPLIIEKVANADAMEVDDLETTERGKSGFGPNDLNPKGSITAKEEGVKICFLHADTETNEFFSAADIGCHPRLTKEERNVIKRSCPCSPDRRMNDTNLDMIRMTGKEGQNRPYRGLELVMLREGGKKIQEQGIEKDGLLYYKNGLYIPENEALQTEMAQGGHDY